MSDQQQVIININKMYVDDLSIEVPNAPQVFIRQDLEPNINLSGTHQVEKLPEDNTHLIKLRLTLSAEDQKTKEKIYLIEVVQCGIFYIEGLNAEQLDHALNVYCPTTLYPYAREVVSSAITKAGFQTIFLQPINFEGIYFHNKAEEEKKNAAKGGKA